MAWWDDLIDRIEGVIDGVRRRIEDTVNGVVGGINGTIDLVVGGVRDRIDSIGTSISGAVNAVYERVDDAIDTVVDFAESLPDTISQRIEDALDGIGDVIGEIIDRVAETFQSFVDSVTEALSNTIASFASRISELYTSITDALSDIGTRIREGIQDAIEAMSERFRETVESLKRFFGDAVDRLDEIYAQVSEVVRSAVERVGEWIRDAAEAAEERIRQIYKEIEDFITERIIEPLKDAGRETKELAAFKADVLRRMAYGEYATFDSFISDLSDPPPVIGAIAGIVGTLMMTMIISPALSVAIRPALQNLTHLVAEEFRPSLLDPATLVSASFRGIIDDGFFRTELAKQGYSDARMGILRDASRPLPSPGNAQIAYLRGVIDESTHDDILRKHGYTDSDIALFKALYRIIPGVPDLIRMAVREAFSPEVAQAFGQYEDFPEVFAEFAEKQGLSREWAERYWASHWDLPSATMGFEMLHRRIIDEDELKLLLRALDVMPFWREKMIQLSYRPYTRVDIRRMYNMGILSEDDVFNAYLDIGYDAEHARNLTEFTIRYYSADEETELDEYRKLSRTLIIKAYERGLSTRDEALNQLNEIGYSPEDAEFLIQLAETEWMIEDTDIEKLPLRTRVRDDIMSAYGRKLVTQPEAKQMLIDIGYSDTEADWLLFTVDYDYASGVRSMIIDAIHTNYVNRSIDRKTAIEQLGAMDVRGEEQDVLFEQWDIERDMRTRRLTQSQYYRAYKSGLIDLDTYADCLRGLGYTEFDVDLLVRMAR